VGCGRSRGPSEVKKAALELGLRVLETERIDAGVRDAVRGLAPELLVVVAFGRIFRDSFLALFPRGGVNAHPSLLPRHRGPSPIPAAILAGDPETGVSIQRIAREVDAGDVYVQRKLALDGTETYDVVGKPTPRADLTLVIHRRNGERVEVPVTCRLDTAEEVSVYEAGGVLQRFAQDFLAAAKTA